MNNNRTNRQDRAINRDQNRRQIDTLTRRLEELARETHDITNQLRALALANNDDDGNNVAPIPTPLAVGDRVEITNRYLNQQGTRGTVTNITPNWVFLRSDTNGAELRRKIHNVRRIA